jgi:hypothetical protein
MERIAIGTLAALVVAQGAYTLKLQRNLRAVNERLDRAAPAEVAEAPATTAVPLPRLASLPRLTPASPQAAAPLPPVLEALGTAEAKAKIQEVLGAIKEDRRREKLVKSVDRREKLDQKMRDLMGPELALTADEHARARELLTRAMTARRHAIEELQSGARTRAEAKSEVDGATKAVDEELEKLLGAQRLVSYRNLRKKAATP